MIRVFGINDKVFTTNGEVVLSPTKCKVSNEDGGEFRLDLTAPFEYAPFLINNNIIVTPTPIGDQPFRIYDVSKSMKSIEVKARHITYDSLNYVIADSYVVDKNGQGALDHLNAATDNPSPFTMYSDVTTIDSYRCVRESLNDAINVVAERWGGHIVRKDFTISLLSSIARDNGITIEYGKNLQSLTANYDFSAVCTKVLPVGKDGQLLDELYIYATTQYEIPYTKVVDFEQDIDEEDFPSEEAYIAALKADLRAQATAYVNAACVPSVNYTLKGKPEKVSDIGDIIRVYDKRLGIDITTQVISYEYDSISESYKSLEFGNSTKTLGDLMSVIKAEVQVDVKESGGGGAAGIKSITPVYTDIPRVEVAKYKDAGDVEHSLFAPDPQVKDVKVDGDSVVIDKVANIDTMTGASDEEDGKGGLVPAPSAGDEDKVLNGAGEWVAQSGGASDLSDLDDVNLSNPSNGQILTYNGSKWANSNKPSYAVNDLSDTAISTPTNGQVLGYNSTSQKWENQTAPSGTLAGLTDTAISSPADGQALEYNGTSSKWVNVAKKADNTQATITEAQTRDNLADGDTVPTIFGKIKKWFSDLKTVAFTGSYSDLTNKPTIPAAQIQSDWTQTDTTKADYIKNKPTVPAGGVTGVKGNAESTYRTGDVNITPANVGALALSGGTLTDRLNLNKTLKRLLTGTGTTGQDKGSGQTNRYVPTVWTVNAAITPQDGDEIMLKIPAAGISYGVWLSVDNGTNYYPVGRNDTSRLQTQFANGTTIYLVYQTNANMSMYARGGADSSTTYTGNYWKVVNYYDTNTDTLVKQTDLTSNSARRVILSSSASSTEATAQVYKSDFLTFNPSTKTLKTSIIETNDPSYTDTAILKPTTDGYGNIGVSNKTFNQGFLRQLFLGRAGSANGGVTFYRSDQSSYYTSLYSENPTANRALLLPNADGTLATQEWDNSNFVNSDSKRLFTKSTAGDSAEGNAVRITMTYAGYAYFTGILFTRYGVAALTFGYSSNTTNSGFITVSRLFGGTANETFTGSVIAQSSTQGIFQVLSNATWNHFSMFGMTSGSSDLITAFTQVKV